MGKQDTQPVSSTDSQPTDVELNGQRSSSTGPKHNSMKRKLQEYMDNLQINSDVKKPKLDDNLCALCNSKPSEVSLVPCGDLFCFGCIQFMRNCSTCRRPWKGLKLL